MSAPTGICRIAALGGGTGLSALLRGLKHGPVDLTAIVTVADDGGSSGRLRRELGVPPPGDIRNCLVALADDESLLSQLFQHRFADGDLAGHSFGNLFLAALTEVTGDFDLAIEECSQVLKIRGRVLPSTLAHVRLWAERLDGTQVCGETQIASGRGACRRAWLDPPNPEAHVPSIDAICEADMVLMGPGSLFSSVLVHLAVPAIARAVADSRGKRVYVCNIMTQPGETDGLDAARHVEHVQEAVPGGIDVVVVHEGPLDAAGVSAYAAQGQEPVRVDRVALERLGVEVVGADLAEPGEVVRHAPDALAAVLLDLAATQIAGERRDRAFREFVKRV
jgi:uncharacterized cofD-like protein